MKIIHWLSSTGSLSFLHYWVLQAQAYSALFLQGLRAKIQKSKNPNIATNLLTIALAYERSHADSTNAIKFY